MRVDHVNIVVADMERSLAFYRDLLGMKVTFEAALTGDWIETVSGLPGVEARCVFCQPPGGGTRFELLEYQMPPGSGQSENDANTLGLRHVALEVDDLDGLYMRLAAVGVSFVSGPVTVPFSVAGVRKRLCYLRDPDGALVEIAEYQEAIVEEPTPAHELATAIPQSRTAAATPKKCKAKQ